jgi:adenosylmethionine-8-amino-7-oxononanoate aminotransferase
MNVLSPDRRLDHIVHPCMSMKDLIHYPPLLVEHAEGAWITLQDGRRLLDGISSWWCKPLGHRHPAIIGAIEKQLSQFEHVIFANTTYETAIQFAETLTSMTQPLNKICFASDGSCAVEMAMKMSLHIRSITKQSLRTQFLGLQNGYHGETGLALSASDVGLYREPYEAGLHAYPMLQGVPYVSGPDDPLWQNAESVWGPIEKQLTLIAHTLTAVMQGAGGMLIYSADFLKRLHSWCVAHDIHFIADEIMTGLWRTGKFLACQHADIMPDFLCLSKALTAGALPMSVMLTRDDLYQYFYGDTAQQHFLHSHTHSGNALAMAAALACLQTLPQAITPTLPTLEKTLKASMFRVAEASGSLDNIRCLGGMIAADLKGFSALPRAGFLFSQWAMQNGALLRSLGNTIYWFPPLNITSDDIQYLADVTLKSLWQLKGGYHA